MRHQDYVNQLREQLKELQSWEHVQGDESYGKRENKNVGEALATEELFCMSERAPGEVCETRERSQGPQVADIYSPPRVAALLPRDGLCPGFSMDITTNDKLGKPWDFDDAKQRQKAR